MKISPNGMQAIIAYEGFRDRAYQDIVGVWTIGYGFIEGVKQGDVMTRTEADARFGRLLAEYEAAVNQAVDNQATQNQFDALMSLAWNIGKAGLQNSTVIRAHRRGDYAGAARAFAMWNKAGGQVRNALVIRRAKEAATYLEPDTQPAEYAETMPQKIDAEPTWMSKNKAGVIAGGSAVAASISEITTTISSVKLSLTSLGDWLMPVLLVVAVAAIGVLLYQRWKQHNQGAS